MEHWRGNWADGRALPLPNKEIKNYACELNTIAQNMLQHGLKRLVRKWDRPNSTAAGKVHMRSANFF